MSEREWVGPVPEKDDFGYTIGGVFIDGKLQRGPWAIMTPGNHRLHGVGLGTGRGQKYKKNPDGKWVKVEG